MSFNQGGGSSRISTSSDVALNSPTDGQVLTYNVSLQKWQNSVAPSALVSSVNSQTGAVSIKPGATIVSWDGTGSAPTRPTAATGEVTWAFPANKDPATNTTVQDGDAWEYTTTNVFGIRGTASKAGVGSSIIINQSDFSSAPQAGDVLLAFVWMSSTSNAGSTPNTPSGWTLQNSAFDSFGNPSESGGLILTRVAGSSEGAYTFTSPGTSNVMLAEVYAISNADTTTIIDGAPPGPGASNGTSSSARSFQPTVGTGSLLFAAWSIYTNTSETVTFTVPVAMTQDVQTGIWSAGNGVGIWGATGHLTLSGSGLTGIQRATLSQAERNNGFAIAILPSSQQLPPNQFVRLLRRNGSWQSSSGTVTSVAGKVGAVSLAQSDIPGLSTALAAKADLVSGTVPASQLTGVVKTINSSAPDGAGNINVSTGSITADSLANSFTSYVPSDSSHSNIVMQKDLIVTSVGGTTDAVTSQNVNTLGGYYAPEGIFQDYTSQIAAFTVSNNGAGQINFQFNSDQIRAGGAYFLNPTYDGIARWLELPSKMDTKLASSNGETGGQNTYGIPRATRFTLVIESAPTASTNSWNLGTYGSLSVPTNSSQRCLSIIELAFNWYTGWYVDRQKDFTNYQPLIQDHSNNAAYNASTTIPYKALRGTPAGFVNQMLTELAMLSSGVVARLNSQHVEVRVSNNQYNPTTYKVLSPSWAPGMTNLVGFYNGLSTMSTADSYGYGGYCFWIGNENLTSATTVAGYGTAANYASMPHNTSLTALHEVSHQLDFFMNNADGSTSQYGRNAVFESSSSFWQTMWSTNIVNNSHAGAYARTSALEGYAEAGAAYQYFKSTGDNTWLYYVFGGWDSGVPTIINNYVSWMDGRGMRS